MKLLIVSVICLVPLISARSFKGRETDTCITDYLKYSGVFESKIGNPPSSLCLAIVEVTKKQILQGIRVELQNDKKMSEEADCVTEDLQESDLGTTLLLLYAYETAEEIEDLERSEKLRQTEIKVTKSIFDAFVSCQAEKKFGEVFDKLMEPESSSEEEIDPKEDYCIRKHVIDNKLIDEQLSLPVNPNNVDTTKIDCSSLYQKALKDAEDDLVKALMDEDSSESEQTVTQQNGDIPCLLNIVRNGKFIDRMLQFDYVKELNLNSSKKNEMRKKFIIVMTKLAQSSSKCFL